MKKQDIRNVRFGWLVAKEPTEERSRRRVVWACVCDCGQPVKRTASELRSGRFKSCGCYRKAMMSAVGRGNMTHGLTDTYIWTCWKEMLTRCYNAQSRPYPLYGGRGIRVCEFIRAGAYNLLSLVGERSTVKHSIDRIKNEGHYTCGQCAECLRCGHPLNLRWATDKEQSRNRRTNRIVELRGERKYLVEWAETIGISLELLRYRLAHGVDPFKPKEVRKPRALCP